MTEVAQAAQETVQMGQIQQAQHRVVKLDIGCGPRKNEGHIGIDGLPFPGVDLIGDLSQTTWVLKPGEGFDIQANLDILEENPIGVTPTPSGYRFKDGVVDHVESSHFLEHLDGIQRIGFFNELGRVLKKGGTARFITPHWSHERAYGDPTHKFPPVCSWTYFYINAQWRSANAPHAGYTCDFDTNLAGTHDPNDQWVAFRNMETKAIMMTRNINTVTDLIANLTKR